jgi:hypothetical protein
MLLMKGPSVARIHNSSSRRRCHQISRIQVSQTLPHIWEQTAAAACGYQHYCEHHHERHEGQPAVHQLVRAPEHLVGAGDDLREEAVELEPEDPAGVDADRRQDVAGEVVGEPQHHPANVRFTKAATRPPGSSIPASIVGSIWRSESQPISGGLAGRAIARAGMTATPRLVVREGGLRVVVAAASAARRNGADTAPRRALDCG